jgi:hypothetical protein
MYQDIYRFVQNCDACSASTLWQDHCQGFLKPLPIPDRLWSEISVDFVIDLNPSQDCTNIIVVTDCLGKGVIFKGLKDIKVETVVKWFVQKYYSCHYLLRAIVSDCGTQFVSLLWARIYQLLKIVQWLSTVYHPETDSSTEQMNSTIEDYLCTFCNYAQDDWYNLLPLAQVVVMGRDTALTGVSPFFLEYSWHIELLDLQLKPEPCTTGQSLIQYTKVIVQKLQVAREWAQASMATAQ